MLIVAIPKSASTSLLKTLEELHGIKSLQDFSIRQNEPPDNAQWLYKEHSDLRELSSEITERFSQKDVFFKQHVFPSDNNLALLRDVKKVVLLRDPEEIILAYYRGAHKKVQRLLEGYTLNLTQEEWIEKAQKDGLLADLKVFYNRWLEEESSNTLIIWYKDILGRPKEVINAIEIFFGLKPTESEVDLARERYSRRKGLEHNLYQMRVFSRRVANTILRKLKMYI